MVMTIKDLHGAPSAYPRMCRPEVVIRVTNPRTKMVCEFNVPTTHEGYDENVQQQAFKTLAGILEKWGFEPPMAEELKALGEAIEKGYEQRDETPLPVDEELAITHPSDTRTPDP
jgi:hypothetical protein